MPFPHTLRAEFGALALLLTCAFASPSPAEPAVTGYTNFQQLKEELNVLAESPLATLDSLATTRDGREVLMLAIGDSPDAPKPAVLILGSVQAESLVGSEMTVRMARTLLERAEDDETVKELLDKVTFYIVPRPSPDASEGFFASPLAERKVNSTPFDDDRDGLVDEDPGNDLNGDGLITQMRVEDPTGEYIPSPADPRILVKADPLKGEVGRYKLYTEGVDDDGDRKWNEDGAGGVDFNRNFTFEYPYFGEGAGPHQVSEAESRGVADFAFDHDNIFLVFSFGPEGNLVHEWKTKTDSGRIKTSVQVQDEKILSKFAEAYADAFETKAAPPAASWDGSISAWAYFHYGRWSIATPGWWPPASEDEAEDKDAEKDANKAGDGASGDDKKPADEAPDSAGDAEESVEESTKGEAGDGQASDAQDDDAESEGEKPDDEESKDAEEDDRGKREISLLKWMERTGVEGFVPWAKVDHADFPGKTVEVGGFKPYSASHPPATELDDLATKHLDFLVESLGWRPQLDIAEANAESLGSRIYRVRSVVTNKGRMPTASQMGEISRQLQRLDVQLVAPEGTEVLAGPLRQAVGVLAGGGGSAEQLWVVRLPEDGDANQLSVKAGAPQIGWAEATVRLQEEQE